MYEIPEGVLVDLKNIRQDMHLRWNPKAKLVTPGGWDGGGAFTPPVFEPRWELWDRDPQGADYMVMRLQFPDESFRQPGDWLIYHLRLHNPERYESIEHMLYVLSEQPDEKRQDIATKDSDALIDAVANWAQWCETPKSAAALTNRGQKLLSN